MYDKKDAQAVAEALKEHPYNGDPHATLDAIIGLEKKALLDGTERGSVAVRYLWQRMETQVDKWVKDELRVAE